MEEQSVTTLFRHCFNYCKCKASVFLNFREWVLLYWDPHFKIWQRTWTEISAACLSFLWAGPLGSCVAPWLVGFSLTTRISSSFWVSKHQPPLFSACPDFIPWLFVGQAQPVECLITEAASAGASSLAAGLLDSLPLPGQLEGVWKPDWPWGASAAPWTGLTFTAMSALLQAHTLADHEALLFWG